jgi:hypothetical protein
MAQMPLVSQGLSLTRLHDHALQDSSGRVISQTQRPLPNNTKHNRQTSMTPAGFESTIPANQRPQTHALDRVATEIGQKCEYSKLIWSRSFNFNIENDYLICEIKTGFYSPSSQYIAICPRTLSNCDDGHY